MNFLALPALASVSDIGLMDFDGEPRARDLDIAERLGFDRPRKIREIIERNLSEIEGFGSTPRRGASIVSGRGAVREFDEYWLNEGQSLLVSVLSRAPNAPAVRAMLIRVFLAHRRGAFDQQPILAALSDLRAEVREMRELHLDTLVRARHRQAGATKKKTRAVGTTAEKIAGIIRSRRRITMCALTRATQPIRAEEIRSVIRSLEEGGFVTRERIAPRRGRPATLLTWISP